MTTIGQPQPEGPGQARPYGLGKVRGRVALVTGGTRGIGAAICHELAAAGADIAAGYWRGPEGAEKFAASMAVRVPRAAITVHHGNIGEAGDCRRVLGEVIDQHGRLDILVNNAGITIDRTVAKMTDEDWQKVIAVNLSGAFFMAQAALEHMLERGTGRIISVSSVIGETGNIGQANYAASKSGLFGLTKSLAKEAVFQLSRAQRPVGRRDRADRERGHARVHRDRHDRHHPGQGAGPDPRADPGRPARQARGNRPGGLLPGGRRVRVHHRADLGRQRRPGHVTCDIMTGGIMQGHRDVLVLSGTRTADRQVRRRPGGSPAV